MDSNMRNQNGHNQSNYSQPRRSTGVRKGKVKMDSISKGLLKLLDEIEDKYKLGRDIKVDAQKSNDLKFVPIRQVHDYVMSTVSVVPATLRRSRNIEVSGIMGSVLYLSHLMEFRNLCRVDFRDHPGITQIVKLLGRFYKYDNCTYEKGEYLNAVLESLELYESVSMMRINTKLSYKLLRVFYLLIVYDNLIDASIIAKLILEQVKLSMDILASEGNSFPNNYQGYGSPYSEDKKDVGSYRTNKEEKEQAKAKEKQPIKNQESQPVNSKYINKQESQPVNSKYRNKQESQSINSKYSHKQESQSKTNQFSNVNKLKILNQQEPDIAEHQPNNRQGVKQQAEQTTQVQQLRRKRTPPSTNFNDGFDEPISPTRVIERTAMNSIPKNGMNAF